MNFHHVQDQAHLQYLLLHSEALDHKDDRLRTQRQEEQTQRYLYTSDSDDDSSSGSLQELDFSYAPCQQEQYSIDHFIENLQADEDSD